LTYGEPQLVDLATQNGFDASQILGLAASLEQYSKHPLSQAILDAASERELALHEASSISEEPGRGLRGRICDHDVVITGRKGSATLTVRRWSDCRRRKAVSNA
jgi:cation transport ATPase